MFEDVREEEEKGTVKDSSFKNYSCSDESSSIGKNSYLSEDLLEKSGDGEEIPLYAMEALEEVLRMRRGISKFLGDASSSTSIKGIAKPDNAYVRKRRNLLSYNLNWDKPSLRGNISERVMGSSGTTLALAVELRNSDSIGGSLPRKDFSTWRSFTLTDLQHFFRKFDRVKEKDLYVGEELLKENMPLQNGARLYHLQGLRPQTWYEVKISYPASIPSSFSLQLKRGTSELGLNQGRKLLNTEKLIFKTDGLLPLGEQGKISVLVNVEPEGVVAIPGKKEREHVVFNIVCDELLLGIPHKAWYVVVLVVVCLVLAFVVPSFLPPYLLPKNERCPLSDCTVTKNS